ncbi:MAG: hypothetical protein J7J67_01840 [Thermoproteales archaeon]|nr:hypothetical protein [Thermoproteales archaeon]
MIKKDKNMNLLSIHEKDIVRKILDERGVAGPARINYYNFARELKAKKPLNELIEKYLQRGCDEAILNILALLFK